MANWSNPVLTSTYASVLAELDARLDEAATCFPSTGTYTNLPTGTISFRNSKWQSWNGTAWVDLSSNYAINISGNATNITGTLAVAKGGTNITAYTVGDILYASGSTTLARLAAVGAGNVLKSTAVAGAPAWGKVSLTDDVSGVLPVTLGGTGVTSLSGIVKGNGTSDFSVAVAGVDYAAASHTHAYLPLSGGTLTGNLTLANSTNSMAIIIGSSGGYMYGNTTTIGFTKTSGANITFNMTTGDISTNGTIAASSDIRLKSNVGTISNALTKVLQLRGVHYEMRGTPSIGVIAQELEQVFPELVFTDSDGYKSVAYSNIVGVLIEAIKELKAEVDKLKC